MLYAICLACCAIGTTSMVQSKVCTDFDKNNNIIGQHSAWAHCTASGGKSGTANSCDCNAPLSIACKKACKKL